MERALQQKFLRELLKIVLVLGGAFLAFSLATHGLVFSCMPRPDHEDEGEFSTRGVPAGSCSGKPCIMLLVLHKAHDASLHDRGVATWPHW